MHQYRTGGTQHSLLVLRTPAWTEETFQRSPVSKVMSSTGCWQISKMNQITLPGRTDVLEHDIRVADELLFCHCYVMLHHLCKR